MFSTGWNEEQMMDGLMHTAAAAAVQTGDHMPLAKADAFQVTEFERLMREGQAGDQASGASLNKFRNFDTYVNAGESPSQWLSETVLRHGKEVSNAYRNGLEH